MRTSGQRTALRHDLLDRSLPAESDAVQSMAATAERMQERRCHVAAMDK